MGIAILTWRFFNVKGSSVVLQNSIVANNAGGNSPA